VTNTFFCLWIHITYTFLHKKKSTFYQIVFFLTCKINNFGSKSQTFTQQNSRLFFLSTSFAHFV